MIIQDYICVCSSCSTEQKFYRMLSGGKYEPPKCLENKCSQCGGQLTRADVTNWDEVEESIRGPVGPPGLLVDLRNSIQSPENDTVWDEVDPSEKQGPSGVE